MKNTDIIYLTDVHLLTCVVASGLSETVLKAAREVGATAGAISHRARGIGARERFGLLGIAVEAEKDVINILVSSEQRDFVYDTIYRAANLDVSGKGYIYLTPLEKASAYIPESLRNQIDQDDRSPESS